MEAKPSLPGVRSPPLRERRSKVRWPRWGNPEMARKAIFSEGRTPCVRIERLRECRGIPFAADGLTMSRWPRGHMPRSSRCLPIRACGARPSRGGRSKGRWLYGRKPGDGAKGGFFGGTRSPRPRCKAGREPGHNIIIGGKWTPGGLMGRSLGASEALFAGVRSPPLREMAKRRREGLTGANPEMTRKAVFSEGRTLCVREYGSGASRGIT